MIGTSLERTLEAIASRIDASAMQELRDRELRAAASIATIVPGRIGRVSRNYEPRSSATTRSLARGSARENRTVSKQTIHGNVHRV